MSTDTTMYAESQFFHIVQKITYNATNTFTHMLFKIKINRNPVYNFYM